MNSAPRSFEAQARQRPSSSLADLLRFLLQNKKWWLTPIIVVLLLLGALVLVGGSGAAPFVYSLF